MWDWTHTSTPLGVSISPEKLLKVRLGNLEHVTEKAGPELPWSIKIAMQCQNSHSARGSKVKLAWNARMKKTVWQSCIAEYPLTFLFDIQPLFQENVELLLNVVKRVYSHVVGLALLPPLLALRWGHERLSALLAVRSVLLWTTEQYLPFSSNR